MKKTPYWWEVIERAKKRKKEGKEPFTAGQINKANQWTTCACGKQGHHILRHDDGMEPLDYELSDLGILFSVVVQRQLPSAAGAILRKIEKRAAIALKDALCST